MRTMILSVLIAVFGGSFTGAAAPLQPEITVDRYLLRAEQMMTENNYKAALDLMDKIVALQKEHGLTLPEAFHFKYAQVAFSAGSFPVALESVNRYLAAVGREGEFYREALRLFDNVEEIQTLLDEYPAQVELLLVTLQENFNLTLLRDTLELLDEDRKRKQEARAGWYGILGAIMGGLIGWGATYFTTLKLDRERQTFDLLKIYQRNFFDYSTVLYYLKNWDKEMLTKKDTKIDKIRKIGNWFDIFAALIVRQRLDPRLVKDLEVETAIRNFWCNATKSSNICEDLQTCTWKNMKRLCNED